MNWIQRILALFGRQYVVLIFFDGKSRVRHAYVLGNAVYAHPYLPETRVRLLPGGKTKGRDYIVGWEPITDKTQQLYNSIREVGEIRGIKEG